MADDTSLIAAGWGHTADYHDWVVGLPIDEGFHVLVASVRHPGGETEHGFQDFLLTRRAGGQPVVRAVYRQGERVA